MTRMALRFLIAGTLNISRTQPYRFAVCLQYHLVEFAPGYPGCKFQPSMVFIDLRRTRDVDLIFAASKVPILWRDLLIFL